MQSKTGKSCSFFKLVSGTREAIFFPEQIVGTPCVVNPWREPDSQT